MYSRLVANAINISKISVIKINHLINLKHLRLGLNVFFLFQVALLV